MNDAIVPDDKDWTWVLDRRCDECGLDAGAIPTGDVSAMIRDNAARWQAVLDSGSPSLAVRPTPGRWSTLEYGAHVRDVYRLYGERLRLMLDHDDPLFPNWDQDEAAVTERYGEQDPAGVAVDLGAAAEALADAFAGIDAEQWTRPGRRSDGAAFTVTSFARYMIHDPIHHLWDVTHS